MMEEWEIEQQYKSKNPILAHIKWQRLKNCVKLANLKPREKILDFGCFTKKLEKVLPKKTWYIGYDIEKQYSDIEDYTKLSHIKTVFAISVFEHMTTNQLETTLWNFRHMGINKLIVELPREDSIINKTINFLLGYGIQTVLNHKLNWQTIIKIIDKYYTCTAYKNYYWINWHLKFEERK